MEELSVELELFDAKRSEWLVRHEGKYVLVKGNEVVGFFESAETAFENGIDRWGNVPMLIKRVLPDDPIESIPALHFGLIDVRS